MGVGAGEEDGGLDMAEEKGKRYRRMDSDLAEEDDGAGAESRRQREIKNSNTTQKYVFACALFASLNSVLLGYGFFYMNGLVGFNIAKQDS